MLLFKQMPWKFPSNQPPWSWHERYWSGWLTKITLSPLNPKTSSLRPCPLFWPSVCGHAVTFSINNVTSSGLFSSLKFFDACLSPNVPNPAGCRNHAFLKGEPALTSQKPRLERSNLQWKDVEVFLVYMLPKYIYIYIYIQKAFLQANVSPHGWKS